MSKVMIMDHPLIQHKIGIIRRQETGSKDFRQLISEIAMLMCYEATRDLKLTDVEQDDSERAGRKETGCGSDSPCRTGDGRRNAFHDPGSQSRSYWSLQK